MCFICLMFTIPLFTDTHIHTHSNINTNVCIHNTNTNSQMLVAADANAQSVNRRSILKAYHAHTVRLLSSYVLYGKIGDIIKITKKWPCRHAISVLRLSWKILCILLSLPTDNPHYWQNNHKNSRKWWCDRENTYLFTCLPMLTRSLGPSHGMCHSNVHIAKRGDRFTNTTFATDEHER